jgi:hypothetical protein
LVVEVQQLGATSNAWHAMASPGHDLLNVSHSD